MTQYSHKSSVFLFNPQNAILNQTHRGFVYMPVIPFLKGDKVDNNVDYRDALNVNYYAVQRQIFDSKGYLLNWYGLTDFGTGQGISRGGIWVEAIKFSGHYRVSGTSLIRIEDNESITVLGTVAGTDQARFAYSLNNLAIVANGRLYYYNPTDGFREITDTDVGTPLDIIWADFRFILTDGSFLFQSDITDEEAYEPLDFGAADFQPDRITGVGLDEDNQLIAFNINTTEWFFNTNVDNFSYIRIDQKAIKAGVLGASCKAEYKDKWYCLTRRVNTQPQFAIIQSGTSESITTREIEKVLNKYTEDELSTTVIEVFTKDAVTWMIAHLPGETLAFNDTIAQSLGANYAWTILKTGVLNDIDYRAKDAVFDPRFKKWIVGDKQDGRLGFFDDSECTQYGEIVEGLLFSPMLRLETLSIDLINIQTIPGIAPSEDATVFISFNRDGRIEGKEWTQVYGEKFDYNQRFQIRRPSGYIRNVISMRIRTASRSRMSFCNFEFEAS